MKKSLSLYPGAFFAAQIKADLEQCNAITDSSGLHLSEQEMQQLIQQHTAALENTGRVEFCGSILPKLVSAFYASPYLVPRQYAQTLAALQDLFYQLKNDTYDQIPDDDLIATMVHFFNNRAHGSIEILADIAPEEWLDEWKDLKK